MKKNVGKVDQIIRYVIGAILIVLSFVLPLYWLLIPAVIAIATAYFGMCGLYRLFGINTCKYNPKK